MKHLSKTLMTAFGLITAMALAPTSASAAGNLQLNLPGLSIGLYDDHGYKNQRKRYNNQRRNNYKDSHSRHDRNYKQSRANNNYDRGSNRDYNNRRYNDNNYYSGRSNNDRRYYNNSRRAQVCPVDGYSQGYDRNRNCYKHEGHFHCS